MYMYIYIYMCIYIYIYIYIHRIAQNFGGENFGEFGETNAICQYFTQPNSRFTKVPNVSCCIFANIFLIKKYIYITLSHFRSKGKASA